VAAHNHAAVWRSRLLGCPAKSRMGCVTSRAQELLREALMLPVNERADVAAELLASLDDAPPDNPAKVEAAWAHEIERRARRVMNGESAGEPWEDVRARVVQRLTER